MTFGVGPLGGGGAAVSGFLSWMHWVELEVQGVDDLLEGLSRLKGALMAVGAAAILAPVETYNTRGGVSKERKEVQPVWTSR